MTDCPTTADWDELQREACPPARAEELAAHVERCPACADRLAALGGDGPCARLIRGGPTPSPVSPAAAALIDRLIGGAASEAAPRRIGPYRVLAEIGRGGMGVVYRAEDPALRREVAVKVLAPHLAKNSAARRAFLRESRAAAAVAHDHVVPVYRAGVAGGVPFLVMPLLRGESLAARLRRAGGQPLPTDEVARVGREAALALSAAHVAGLIHRDVKPANMWIEEPTGRVKLLDFGLASPGGSGGVAGTAASMAPEQATGQTIDTRADLFGLGCALYEMATGAPPFVGAARELDAANARRAVPPRERNPALPANLARLIGRLLDPNPARRPETAADVARALAAPAWSRRKLLAVGAATVAGLVAAPFVPRAGRYLIDRCELTLDADDPTATVVVRRAGTGDVAAKLTRGSSAFVPAGEYDAALADDVPWLHPPRPALTARRGGSLRITLRRDMTDPDPDAPLAEVRVFTGHDDAIHTVAVTPDGRHVVTAGGNRYREETNGWRTGNDYTVRVWQVRDGRGQVVARLKSPVASAVAGPDGTIYAGDCNGRVSAWAVEPSRHVRDYGTTFREDYSGRAFALALSPDGERLAVGTWEPRLRVYATADAREVWAVDETCGNVKSVAVSPDGRTVARVGDDGGVGLRDAATGELRQSTDAKAGPLWAVAWSPDGSQLATAGEDGLVRLWPAGGGPARVVGRHDGYARALAWLPDGRRLLTAGADRTVRLWDVAAGRELACYRGHAKVVSCVAVAPGGRWAISGSYDGTARLLRLPS